MKASCLRVRRRIDSCFDESNRGGGLSDRDAIHLHSCRGCSEYYRGYSRFAGALKDGALEAASAMEEPDWGALLLEGRGEGAELPAARTGTRTLLHRLPRWATGAVAKAALIAVIVGLGALFGYDQYRMATARSYVRTETTSFVNAMFAASFFSADTEGAATADPTSGWFDATSISSDLPLQPPGAGTSGGTTQSP